MFEARALTIPFVGLSLLAGCTEEVVGEWNMTRWDYPGGFSTFPDRYYDYYSYCNVTLSYEMEIEPDLSGTARGFTQYSGCYYGADNASYVDTDSVTVEENGKDAWRIVVGGDLMLTCTVDRKKMKCDDGAGNTLHYEK
jgi:hypothetical protein